MTTKRYAIIIQATGVVHNVCEWDGNLSTWRPDPGTIAIQTDEAARGMIYKNGVFSRPPPSAAVPTDEIPMDKEPVEALTDLLVQKKLLTEDEARPFFTKKEGKDGPLRGNK